MLLVTIKLHQVPLAFPLRSDLKVKAAITTATIAVVTLVCVVIPKHQYLKEVQLSILQAIHPK